MPDACGPDCFGCPWVTNPCSTPPAPGAGYTHCMTANFSIYYSETAGGEYKTHEAQILDWPVHSRGRPWDYGPFSRGGH